MNVHVLLNKSHTHSGVKLEPGKKVEVSEVEAQWLVDNGIGEVIDKEPDIKPGKDSKK